jgi:hypothetical protein
MELRFGRLGQAVELEQELSERCEALWAEPLRPFSLEVGDRLKTAWPIDDAREEMTRLAGSQFDPEVVDAFNELDHAHLAHDADPQRRRPRLRVVA